ncbi:MAG: O-antigen ligase family protein [Oligosphaeraceae bacterium]|nr:O-antigen ligase family protein [Oligosphaeraceae bacterium]
MPVHANIPGTIAKRFAVALRWYLYALIFILPFKFGTFATGGEMPDFPLSLMEWLVFTGWPYFLPGILCGLALLLAVLVHRPPRFLQIKALPLLLGLMMIVTCLIGFINSTEWHYAINFFRHFWACFALSLAVYWTQEQDEKLLPGLINCIAIACIICCLQGWRQRFGGLEANRRMMELNAQETGEELSRQMLEKLKQTRAYASFVDPNVYAGHLLLCAPFMLLALRNWSRRVEPQRLSKPLFLGLGSLLFVGALLFSGSRGALVGFAAGLGILLWLSPLPLRWRLLLICSALLVGLGLVLLATYFSQRDLLSASVRMQYYRSSWQIFKQHPLAGAGLGEFFPWHMRLKPPLSEEARDPHSLFFALLGQCGLFGMLTALCRIAFPFALALGLWREQQPADRQLFTAVTCALGAWLVHAQFQFNDTVPASSYIAAFAGFWLLQKNGGCEEFKHSRRTSWLLRLSALLIALLALLPLRNIAAERELQCLVSRPASSPQLFMLRMQDLQHSLPFSPVPPRLLAEFAHRQGDLQTALAANLELVRRTPHRSSSWCRLAKTQLGLDMQAEAEASLDSAALWYPYNPRLFPLQAVLQLQRMPAFKVLPLPLRYVGIQALLSAEAVLAMPTQETLQISFKLPEGDPLHLPEELLALLDKAGLRSPKGESLIFTSASAPQKDTTSL